VQQAAQITQAGFPLLSGAKLARPQGARERMTPKSPRFAVLALDMQDFSLQRQRKGDVGHIVESEPGDRVLQRGNRHGRPFGCRTGDPQYILRECRVGLDDVRQEVRVAGILGAASHNANGNGGQGRNHQFIARDVLLNQAAHGVEVVELLLRLDG